MELKVWVEGIQRIVCGVNEKTTCQDVVFALAHATGKTGRFTLIERWRNSERLLAPSEQPLKVLLKWGEHSNDVQFILQWSPLESANPSNKSGQLKLESSCSDNSSSHSSSPLAKPSSIQAFPSPGTGPGAPNATQLNGPKTFNGASSSSPFNSNDAKYWASQTHSANNGQMPMDLNPNGELRGSLRTTSQPSRTPVDQIFYKSNDYKAVSGPPPYREPPSPACSQSAQGSPLQKSLPPYREPPPPSSSVKGSTAPTTTVFNSVHSSPGNGMTNGIGVSSQKELRYSSMSTSSSSGIQPMQIDSLPINGSLSSSDFEAKKAKDQNSVNGDLSSNQGNAQKFSPQSFSHNSNSHYRELIRVVNSQREKLTSQQAELTQYDAEIMFWEGKSREQQKHMDLINKEISRLESASAQHESQALSLAHLEEEHEYTQRESIALKSEINSLRSELEHCDDEIEQCKKRIRILMEELHITQLQMAHRQQEWLDREASTLAEIEKLRAELDYTAHETEAAQDLSNSLDQEVQSVEHCLVDKRKQMERLVAAMKEANLQSLSIQPPDDLMEMHQRSGSTRRMIGSPRQLENAAPTSKNPHGVWV